MIYIGGMGRSGSTLLDRLLGQVPGVQGLGELAQIWKCVATDEQCSCGRQFSTCDFWQAIGEKAYGGWNNVDVELMLRRQQRLETLRGNPRLVIGRMPANSRQELLDYADHYTRIYQAAAAMSGAKVVIDSSKSPGRAFFLRWLPDIDLRVVQLVRDARGVAYSLTKKSKNGVRLRNRRPAASAMNWTRLQLAFELLGWLSRRAERRTRSARLSTDELPRCRLMRLRYEDLIVDPLSCVRAIAAFAGVPLAEADLRHIGTGQASLRAAHNVFGNPMRFTTGDVGLRVDDAWMSHLPPAQKAMVTGICGPLLTRYGYPLLPRPVRPF